jgi:hypothetical protein
MSWQSPLEMGACIRTMTKEREAGHNAACTSCQKLRIKCDTVRPCSQCVLRNAGKFCEDKVRWCAGVREGVRDAGFLAPGLINTPRSPICAGAEELLHNMPELTRQMRQGTAVLSLREIEPRIDVLVGG